MKWKVRQSSLDDIKTLQERFNLNLTTAKILAGREVTDSNRIKFWLEEDVSFLHNPFLFEEMEDF
ncbi:MAG: hypothetical protein HUK24_08165, partial [Sphaerochaetaceae bacterium]|nr:hypothetical protein [Sphaerochaetaceae bacterium]